MSGLFSRFFHVPEGVPFRTWYGVAATCFGIGYAKKAPGTVGTAAAYLVLIAAGHIPLWAIVAVTVLGVAASDRYARECGRKDPPEVVIDEVAGMWLAAWGHDPGIALSIFFLFRIIDILKPIPVSTCERLPGGFGIMADDLMGGAIVNVMVIIMSRLFAAGIF